MDNTSEGRRSLLTALLGVSLWTVGEIIARRVLTPKVGRSNPDTQCRALQRRQR